MLHDLTMYEPELLTILSSTRLDISDDDCLMSPLSEDEIPLTFMCCLDSFNFGCFLLKVSLRDILAPILFMISSVVGYHYGYVWLSLTPYALHYETLLSPIFYFSIECLIMVMRLKSYVPKCPQSVNHTYPPLWHYLLCDSCTSSSFQHPHNVSPNLISLRNYMLYVYCSLYFHENKDVIYMLKRFVIHCVISKPLA